MLDRSDRLDDWMRRHAIQFYCGPYPAQKKSKPRPALEGLVRLSGIAQGLKDQYDPFATTPVPAHLTALIEQLKMDAHLRPASIVTAVVYSLLLAAGLIAHAMGFPKFSTEPRATPFISINVPAPLASEDGTIGYR
jgi:hypothetical protein